MIIIKKKTKFSKKENRMKILNNVNEARKIFFSNKSRNLKFLLKNRYDWINSQIETSEVGIEFGAGAGFSKFFIINKNFKISDNSYYDFLDIKNLNALETHFKSETFDFIVCINVIHHLSSPIKFLKEMHRILKSNGKLFIFEPYMSVIFQIILILMKHENFNFDENVWDENKKMSKENDLFDSNAAIPNLLFDDKEKFNKYFEDYYQIEKDCLSEFLVLINSGGVISKTYFIPLNKYFLKLFYYIDKILIFFFPKIFAMGRKIILRKKL